MRCIVLLPFYPGFSRRHELKWICPFNCKVYILGITRFPLQLINWDLFPNLSCFCNKAYCPAVSQILYWQFISPAFSLVKLMLFCLNLPCNACPQCLSLLYITPVNHWKIPSSVNISTRINYPFHLWVEGPLKKKKKTMKKDSAHNKVVYTTTPVAGSWAGAV